MGPIFTEGLKGMHGSYQKMTQAAHQIASQGQPRADDGELASPRAENTPAGANNTAQASSGDLMTPVVEMKQQQHVFTASAKVVSIANETIGSLIDDLS